MKQSFVLLAAACLASASPQGVTAGSKSSSAVPAGCKLVAGDPGFPTLAEVKAALPKAYARAVPLTAKGVGRSDFTVPVSSVSDVQAAVKFAAKRNIRLTIYNSGHDFLGRNDSPSGITLDISRLMGIRTGSLSSFQATAQGVAPVSGDQVKPVPAGEQAIVTFGAGWGTQRLNNALSPVKLVTVGAAHGPVAPAGGYGQTAGHSPLSTTYGLAVDQPLEYKVVTPDGQLKVANKNSNADLFWALRGGGGSTFGIVVEATIKAHPDLPIISSTWEIDSATPNSDGLWAAYAGLHQYFPDFADKQGVAGYYYIFPTKITAMFLHPGASDDTKTKAIWDPILAKLAANPGLTLKGLTTTKYPSFKAYFDARFGAIDVPGAGHSHKVKREPMPMELVHLEARQGHSHTPGVADTHADPAPVPAAGAGAMGAADSEPAPSAMVALDSRLLGADHFKHQNFTAALKAAAPFALSGARAVLQGHLVSGGKVHQSKEDTAVLPAWRKTYTHVIGYREAGKASVDSLRTLAPESGAYANEAFEFEPNWQKSFWGNNYAKLSSIKSKYDPNGLLWVTPGINADAYEVKNGRVCKAAGSAFGSLFGGSPKLPASDNKNTGNVTPP